MRALPATLFALCWTTLPPHGLAQSHQALYDPAQIGRRDINKGKWNFYSPEREIALGRSLATEIERTNQLLRDPLVVGYVTEIAERVVRNSDCRVPIQVRVLDSSQVDAFALPGGYFFISTGMLLEAQTEAELAAIVAHEVAHVAARHATRQMTRVRIWNLMSVPLLFFGGPVAYAVQQGAAIAVPLAFLKFSRDAEREADWLGLEYHYASGYDPVAFVDFFERIKRLEKGKRGGIARAFSTHPMARDRIVAAERFIEQHLPSREEYVVNTSQYDDVRGYLADLLNQRMWQQEGPAPVLRKRSAPGKAFPGRGLP